MATTAERRKQKALESKVAQLIDDKKKRDQIANETPRDKKAREAREQAQQKLIETLGELGGALFHDDDIMYAGSTLVIPETMSLTQAKEFLEKKEKEQERITDFSRTFNYRPYDGAFTFWNVMKQHFGAVAHRDSIKYGVFGATVEKPQMVSIHVDVGKKAQVPWGRFELPFLPGTIFETYAQGHKEYGPLFVLKAAAPKKFQFIIEGIFNLVEDELQKNSLYRGKAFDGQEIPEFVDVFSIDRTKVFYSEAVTTQFEASIWAQLRHTDQFKQLGIPLKRAVLIHGPYGTGKTLAAMLTGQEAIQHGWTFIKARPGRDDLTTVLSTAKLYQPSVVFYEDVDQIATPEMDQQTVSRLLDDFDGIDAKGTAILCVLTTNHPELIHKAMARPGRLDAMIEIEDLDQHGVEMLVRCRIPEASLADTVDWAAVFEAAEGFKPAFVTEFADRTMRYVVVRTGGVLDEKITTEDLVSSARGLRPQYDRMMGAKDRHTPDPMEMLVGNIVAREVAQNQKRVWDEDYEAVEKRAALPAGNSAR